MAEIAIDFPLKGEWQFLRPPGHQPFAFDFVKRDSARKNYQTKTKLHLLFSSVACTDYHCFGEPIYAPIDGKVIRSANDWPDHDKCNLWRTISIWYNATYKFKPVNINGRLDIRPNAGNHVMIQSNAGYIVFLAHMQCGSVVVKEGDTVRVGQELGLVGNSGNSTAPHLHINLFDQMENPLDAKVLPFAFTAYEELKTPQWVKVERGIPTIKSTIRVE